MKYKEIPEPNSLDSMEGVDFEKEPEKILPFGENTIKTIKENAKYVNDSDNGIEKSKREAYSLWQVGYFLNADGNRGLYVKSILASLGEGIRIIQGTVSAEEITDVVGHYIIKSINNALALEELKSKEYIIKLAELVASIYEGWGANRRVQRIYELIDPLRFEKEISRLASLPDNYKEGQSIESISQGTGTFEYEIFHYKELDVDKVKNCISSLSLQELFAIKPGDLLKQLEELADKQ